MPRNSEKSSLESIVELLNRHDVEYILVGGQAEVLYGSSRVTYDVDICYRRTRENLRRLAQALHDLNPRLRDAPPDLPFTLDEFSLALREGLAAELKMISKSHFDIERVLDSAGELKYMRGVRQLIEEEIESPSEDFVRHFATRVYSGRFTATVREQFEGVVKRAFKDLLRDQITERLESALAKESPPPQTEEAAEDDGIETTEEELEGFQIVRAIVSEVVDPSRVAYRDRKTYFAIFLDDNTSKPICRLWFNTSQKYVGLFDEEKNEERVPIDKVQEIFALADRLKTTIGFYGAPSNVGGEG